MAALGRQLPVIDDRLRLDEIVLIILFQAYRQPTILSKIGSNRVER
jgi:hypothetical protein